MIAVSARKYKTNYRIVKSLMLEFALTKFYWKF